MQIWHWQTVYPQAETQAKTQAAARAYLTCDLLKDWAHGFFTRQFWPSPPEELVSLLPLERRPSVYRLKQVHGNRVLRAAELTEMPPTDSKAESRAESRAEADGLVSTAADQAVWACTADCTPILIGDLSTGQTAAVHAGWRGTAAKILPAAVAQLQAQGSQIADLRVAMGPAIAAAQYQVSEQVAAMAGATLVAEANLELFAQPETAASPELAQFCQRLLQLPDSPVLPDPQPGRLRLDVPQVNALQLAQLGFEPDQVAISPYCTYQNPELFFSYRREKQKKVQWSGIVSGARNL
ncbi:peptidoglycan editing factor PgeF [Rivularia sp. UHCC 0363]|uniref:peptidoglycan editing factor PgeF n=1 Tax=Rivularia sp. UHCC 0363 TaxID=3110244 RepID=UPI002B2170E1|nr:peptidoglycan editing factor PgeF [Rivularia sp. UHCC 0363]MEA5597439.1 peptidoglycan editing factor PgeF [Rivularia sp. UHCC 0363]